MKRLLAAITATLAMVFAFTATAFAAPSPTGFGSWWYGLPIGDDTYNVNGTVLTTKSSGNVRTTTTSCKYFSDPDDPNATWQDWEYLGEYTVNGAQASNVEELKAYCISHFDDRV